MTLMIFGLLLAVLVGGATLYATITPEFARAAGVIINR